MAQGGGCARRCSRYLTNGIPFGYPRVNVMSTVGMSLTGLLHKAGRVWLRLIGSGDGDMAPRHLARTPCGASRPFTWPLMSISSAMQAVHVSNLQDHHGSGRWGQALGRFHQGVWSSQRIEAWGLKRVTESGAVSVNADAAAHCGILTLEDFLVRGVVGGSGLPSALVAAASANVALYDSVWCGHRWT